MTSDVGNVWQENSKHDKVHKYTYIDRPTDRMQYLIHLQLALSIRCF